jgi:tetratricopeptide (TPR) repeat protein
VRLIALLLAIVLGSANNDDYAIGLLGHWIAAVDGHAAGESDAALATVTGWSYDDLELMRPYVEAFVDAPLQGNRDRGRRRTLLDNTDLMQIRALAKIRVPRDFDRFRKRAVLLHTDAALLGAPPQAVPTPVPRSRKPRWARETQERGVIVKSFDGRVENYELKNLHWDFAMDVLDALPAIPTRDPIVAQWYRAIGAHFARERAFADALVHFDHAREVVPDSPQVLFGEASLNETLGAPRVQNYVRVTTLPNGLYIRGVDSAATHWKRAEALLRRGRVLIQQQKFEEGLPLVDQAATESSDQGIRYFGHLFAGDAQLALGRPGDSQRSYERALALFPNSQAAQLGLASALRTTGDADALQAILPTLTKPPASRDGDDPWWDYYDGDSAKVDELLEQLRAPFRSPRP